MAFRSRRIFAALRCRLLTPSGLVLTSLVRASSIGGGLVTVGLVTVGVVAGLVLAPNAVADPYLQPNEQLLRHDVQLLSDTGVIRTPVTSWPLSLGDIGRQLPPKRDDASYPRYVQAAIQRLRGYAEFRATAYKPQWSGRLSAQTEERRLRGFGELGRENVELEAKMRTTGRDWAVGLNFQVVDSEYDDERLRADGSFLAYGVGNWMLSVDTLERWWGPGWGGSLILGTSARPTPGISVQRNRSIPFENRFLNWLGPWTLVARFSQLEDDRAIPGALFFSSRVGFRPHQNLEIGLSMGTIWGGEDQSEGLDTFFEIFLDRGDERGEEDEEQANQLAGYDVRWNVPNNIQPFAMYFQAIGEDSHGGLPSDFVGLFGMETSGAWGSNGGSYRLVLEFADTRTRFYRGQPEYGTAYNHDNYATGYRYRGRNLAHSADGDARVGLIALQVADSSHRTYALSLRGGRLNEGDDDGRPNAQTDLGGRRDIAEDFGSLSLDAELPWGSRRLGLGVAYTFSDRHAPNVITDNESEPDSEVIGRISVEF